MSGSDESPDMVARWMEKAENDLRNATHTLTLQEDCPFDTVCFHAQQCVEKRLKAILLRFGADVPRTHDLRAILQMVPASSGLDIDLSEILPLNRYSIEARYPGDWEPITREEAEDAVRIALKVSERTRQLLLSGSGGPPERK